MRAFAVSFAILWVAPSCASTPSIVLDGGSSIPIRGDREAPLPPAPASAEPAEPLVPCHAQEDSLECRYLGLYSKGTGDSLAQLAILDDRSFCLGFLGGSADLSYAGRWEPDDRNPRGIRLRQQRPSGAFFRVQAREDGRGQRSATVVFDFYRYSLGADRPPLAFAVSGTESSPIFLRLLFDSNVTWEKNHARFSVDRKQARYAFLGYVEQPSSPEGTPHLFVVRYEVGEASFLRVDYDPRQTSRLLDLPAQLEAGTLTVDGHGFGERQPLSLEFARRVRRYCIDPVLNPTPPSEAENRHVDEDEVWLTREPSMSFTLDLEAMRGKPWLGKGR